MPTVAVVFGMSIMFFYNDHEPPHLHVEGADFSAKLDLGDLSISEVQGAMRSGEIRRLRTWVYWLRARAKRPLRKVEV